MKIITLVVFVYLCSINISYAAPNYFSANPAELNLSTQPSHSLRYLNFNINAVNNAFTLEQINSNFAKDTIWENTQKMTILNTIPTAGFKVNLDAIAEPIEFATHLFSVSFLYHEWGSVSIPRDLFDLALFGNDLNRTYNLSDAQINALGCSDVAAAFCYPIFKQTKEADATNIWLPTVVNVGGRLHWLKGFHVTQTDSSSGSVATTPDVFLAQERLCQAIATGANSVAFDLGVTTELQKPLTLGIALLNINTGFNWTVKPEKRVLEVGIDSFSLQRYIDANSIDSFYYTKDTTYPIPAFKISIPAQLLIQGSYQPIDLLTISSYYHQYLSDSRFIGDFEHSWNINFYLNLCKLFTTELSFTTNLDKEFVIGNVFHFIIKHINFNLGIDQRNGFFSSAKGFGLNLNFGQNW